MAAINESEINNIDLSLPHAVQLGMHDSVHTLVKFGTIALTIYILDNVLLKGKIEKVARKYLGRI